MRYADPRDGLMHDTNDMTFGQLITLLKYLLRAGRSRGWIDANGVDSAQMLCRAIRARAFRDRNPLPPIERAWLNQLDPPRCRCGRVGTHIIGGTTFCRRCGPSLSSLQRKKRQERKSDEWAGVKERHFNDVDRLLRRADEADKFDKRRGPKA